MRLPGKCLYKDYLGNQYEQKHERIERDDYMLDMADYERVVEEIVMEKAGYPIWHYLRLKADGNGNCQ